VRIVATASHHPLAVLGNGLLELNVGDCQCQGNDGALGAALPDKVVDIVFVQTVQGTKRLNNERSVDVRQTTYLNLVRRAPWMSDFHPLIKRY
jgi:hypothetical protein